MEILILIIRNREWKTDRSFSNNKKFKFTINNKDNNKVTTLFSDNAEPFLKKYKFIKGFKNGHLDFYSVNNGTKFNINFKDL